MTDNNPIAWRYELANARIWNDGVPGEYADWQWRLSDLKPVLGAGIRNVTPLYEQATISRLTAERDGLKDDYLRRHKDACDRWMALKEIELLSDNCVNAERYTAADALNDMQAIRYVIKRLATPAVSDADGAGQ